MLVTRPPSLELPIRFGGISCGGFCLLRASHGNNKNRARIAYIGQMKLPHAATHATLNCKSCVIPVHCTGALLISCKHFAQEVAGSESLSDAVEVAICNLKFTI